MSHLLENTGLLFLHVIMNLNEFLCKFMIECIEPGMYTYMLYLNAKYVVIGIGVICFTVLK